MDAADVSREFQAIPTIIARVVARPQYFKIAARRLVLRTTTRDRRCAPAVHLSPRTRARLEQSIDALLGA